MSKIPQGEWSAIAARYAKGESITRIAQSYGCTPPAIHYILKRSKQRAAHNAEQRLNTQPESVMSVPGEPSRPTIPAASRAVEPRIEEHGDRRSALGEIGALAARPAEPRPVREATTSMPSERIQPAFAQRAAVGAPALTAGLDSELHGRAEAAIAAFRSSFNAALVEGSPVVRQQLRRAASDLMRVAARTTIVLDRLNAIAEREPPRAPDQLRWGEGR
jgi:hypothetical protein